VVSEIGRRLKEFGEPAIYQGTTLAAIWFSFGAALVSQEQRADFGSSTASGRLQNSRRVAAALSILAISSYAWDIHRRRHSRHEHMPAPE
jgi:hypothetical protein